MEFPWTIAEGEVVRVDIDVPDFAPGDWDAVERYLGIGLPTDYREMIGDEPSHLVLDEELFVANPFSTGRINLLRHHASSAWAEAYLRHSHPPGIGEIYPEPGGVLGWGVDGGGGEYWWDTSAGDPDDWTIVVSGRPVYPYEMHPMGLRAYLNGLIDGSIEAAALGEWPGPGAKITRRDQPGR